MQFENQTMTPLEEAEVTGMRALIQSAAAALAERLQEYPAKLQDRILSQLDMELHLRMYATQKRRFSEMDSEVALELPVSDPASG